MIGSSCNLAFVNIDSVDCPIQEPNLFSPMWLLHKFCGLAARYELAVGI